ncbi:hypothetical protein ACIGMX_06420 [Streptomyces aquilus]|uniref:hypothetical protein n=1 Tax=Streptomyces aquilus TaxID=2548456 RepID=UPI0037D0908E
MDGTTVPGHQHRPHGGRPPKHGGEFVFGDPATWFAEQAVTVTDTSRYGKATAQVMRIFRNGSGRSFVKL